MIPSFSLFYGNVEIYAVFQHEAGVQHHTILSCISSWVTVPCNNAQGTWWKLLATEV